MTDIVPPPLEVTELRCVLRTAADVRYPLSLGKILRNGLGQALQQVACPPACHGRAAHCQAATLCSYRALYEGQRADDRRQSQEPPRPYAIVAPPPRPMELRAGDLLQFGVRLFGRARTYVPVVIDAVTALAAAGLGLYRVPARLESVELIAPDQALGRIIGGAAAAPCRDPIAGYNLAELPRLAATYAAAVELELLSHLRLTRVSAPRHRLLIPDLIWAICRRLEDLNANYGEHPWRSPLAEAQQQAEQVHVTAADLRWEDREALSLRNDQKHAFDYGGLIGRMRLQHVSIGIRTLLLAGSLVQVGKYTVQGNGRLALSAERMRPVD